MKVGKAKFGGNQKNFFKLEEGDNVYRILPPLGSLAEKGIWFKYYAIEWGYKNSEGKTKLFQDPRVVNRETGMVEVESAAHLRREALKKKFSEVTEAFKAGKASKEDVVEARNMTMKYNLEKKYHVNAVNLKGEIGLLKIGYKAMKSLEAQIKKLRDEGIDALGMENGIYFNIERSGKGRDTLYQVTVYTEKVEANVNGETQLIDRRKTHTMDDAFIARLDDEAFELDNMYPAPTAEEVEQIVNGGPEALDAVFAKYKGGSRSSSAKTEARTAPTQSSSESVAEEVEFSSEGVDLSGGNIDTVEAAMSDIEKEEVATSKEEISDEDFLKSIGAM